MDRETVQRKAQGDSLETIKGKKWSTHDLIWIILGLCFGLFLIFVGYLFVHLWKNSTLRQLFF